MTNQTSQNRDGSVITEDDVQSHLKTRPMAIRRIARFLYNRFYPLLDSEDLRGHTSTNAIETMLSRSVAAQAVFACTGKQPRQAASCIVDGGQDLGIDAIAFDDTNKRCWLVQSKFAQSGQGELSWTDVSKFLDGFESLTSESFQHANHKILAFSSDIRRAATEVGWKFTLVVATTSANPLSDLAIDKIKSRLNYQDPGNTGTFTFSNFDLNSLTQSVERSLETGRIDLDVELHDWGCVTDPFTAYYGQITLDSIISWRQFGHDLFAKNLRAFLNSSHVTESIAETLSARSELFWYFNNGATILCEQIVRKGPYSASTSRERGHFSCIGVSIVNGAQTIGTIWDQPSEGAALDSRAKMHLRIIPLKDAPTDFAKQVTRATNTQQSILARDFATLDEVQARLARDFTMDGRVYVFRQGDPAPPPDHGTTLDEVTVALACSRSVQLATIAYRNFGFLVDAANPYYQTLFNSAQQPKAEKVWMLVRILRASTRTLDKHKTASLSARHRHVATHGARYVQYRVMNDSLVKSLFGRHSVGDEELLKIVGEATDEHFASVVEHISRHLSQEYLQTLFKNTQKVKAMDDELNAVIGKDSARSVQMGLMYKDLMGDKH
jgi:AIPR protein